MKKFKIALVLVPLLTIGKGVIAASAIATDPGPPFTYGVAYGQQSATAARQSAISRCIKEGGANCSVKTACSEEGFGVIAVYQRGPGTAIESYGAICGEPTLESAKAKALHACEYFLAENLNISLPPLVDTTRALVRSKLAEECPGLGNCHPSSTLYRVTICFY